MRIELQEYTEPDRYAEHYRYNFTQIDGIQGDKLIYELIAQLVAWSGVPYEVVITDCKDYLMQRQEYYPHALRPDIRNELALPHLIVTFFKGLGVEKRSPTDVIVDMWYPEAFDSFYTRELEAGLLKKHRCLFVSFNSLTRMDTRYFVQSLAPFVHCLGLCRRIIKEHGLDLRKYVFTFFRRTLIGLTIGKEMKPKVVISGNDNCFSFLTVKAAKAEVILIQNGKRPLHSLFAFKYADHYIGWGDMSRMMASGLADHIFKHYHNFGSIRLYENLKRTSRGGNGKILYDILWASTWDKPTPPESCNVWRHWDSYEAESSAVGALNDFAQHSDWKIAFQCRGENDVQALAKAGLKSEKITYILPSQQNIYTSISQSRVVLSPISSTVVEAMGMGKKVGFVSLSGNDYMNFLYRGLDIEFSRHSAGDFKDFLKRITEQDRDYQNYFIQNLNYIPDLLKIIDAIVGKQALGETA